MISIFYGIINAGRLFFQNRNQFDDYLAKYKDGTRVEVTVRKYRRTRTLEQNRYYWGVVIYILADFFGYSKEEMHEAMKWKFLKQVDMPIETVRSTTDLSTKEFSDYIENIVRWASSEYQVVIPDPNDVEF